jgi:hypothetical protein
MKEITSTRTTTSFGLGICSSIPSTEAWSVKLYMQQTWDSSIYLEIVRLLTNQQTLRWRSRRLSSTCHPSTELQPHKGESPRAGVTRQKAKLRPKQDMQKAPLA